MANTPPLKLTRNQLAAFLKDHESIKAFENLFNLTEAIAPEAVQDALVAAESAGASALQAQALALQAANDALSTAAVAEARANVALQTANDARTMAELAATDPYQLASSASTIGGNAFTGAQTVAFVALVDAATIDTDAALSNHFRVTLGGNRTLANPTNMRDGGIYNWRVRQPSAGGPWVINSYGSLFRWNAGVPVYPTAANAVLRITGQYVAADNVIECTWTSGWVV